MLLFFLLTVIVLGVAWFLRSQGTIKREIGQWPSSKLTFKPLGDKYDCTSIPAGTPSNPLLTSLFPQVSKIELGGPVDWNNPKLVGRLYSANGQQAVPLEFKVVDEKYTASYPAVGYKISYALATDQSLVEAKYVSYDKSCTYVLGRVDE